MPRLNLTTFSVATKIVLDELRADGDLVQSLDVPNGTQRGIKSNRHVPDLAHSPAAVG